MTELTTRQLATVRAFLAQVRERAAVGIDERVAAAALDLNIPYGWGHYDFRNIDILTACWWYRFRHKPGSTQWRPGVILRALLLASEREYVEPERLPMNAAVLNASAADKKKARLAFIREHGVAAYYRSVQPILESRRLGTRGLFMAPATAETRAYVGILEKIARKRNGATDQTH